MKAVKATLIDCLRHGEIETKGLFCASANKNLSTKGIKQMQDSTQKGHWDIIISSPFLRCSQMAHSLASKKNIPIEIINDFTEMDFGHWINQPIAQLWQNHSKQLQQLWQHPKSFIAPEGESILNFQQRVIKAWKTLLKNHQNKKILLITHAGVIRILLSHCLDIPLKNTQTFEIRHAHYLRLAYYHDDTYSFISHGLKE
ncbi:MAG: histidine phosphatase family protein [Thiotrichaceae bacterium]|nr:histidine phosphatase family protein [Thiotrichaceae bacterium]